MSSIKKLSANGVYVDFGVLLWIHLMNVKQQ